MRVHDAVALARARARGGAQSRRLVRKVADLYELPTEELFARSRRDEVAQARFVCFALMHDRRGLRWSLPRIGRFFALDHTTVMSGERRIREACDFAQAFARGVDLQPEQARLLQKFAFVGVFDGGGFVLTPRAHAVLSLLEHPDAVFAADAP